MINYMMNKGQDNASYFLGFLGPLPVSGIRTPPLPEGLCGDVPLGFGMLLVLFIFTPILCPNLAKLFLVFLLICHNLYS